MAEENRRLEKEQKCMAEESRRLGEEQRRMAEKNRRLEEEHRLMALEIEKREARRKIALAEAEFEVWSESSSTHSGRSIKTFFSKLPVVVKEVNSCNMQWTKQYWSSLFYRL